MKDILKVSIDEWMYLEKAVLTSIINDINQEPKHEDDDFDDYLAKLEEESWLIYVNHFTFSEL